MNINDFRNWLLEQHDPVPVKDILNKFDELCLEISDKKYEFFWTDGSSFQSSGRTPEEAFSKAGYGAGAVKALDYYKTL